MTDYTWPTSVIPSSSEWRLIANTAAFVSPLTGSTQTVARGGDRWACTLTFNNLYGDNRAILAAFLARLRGQAHRVILPDHAYKRRGTNTATTAYSDGYNAINATTVNIRNLTTSQTVAIAAGDWLTLHTTGTTAYPWHTVMAVADAASDGTGDAAVSITPPLRIETNDGNYVTIGVPKFRMLLADNTVSWSNMPGGVRGAFSSMSIQLVEDIT